MNTFKLIVAILTFLFLFCLNSIGQNHFDSQIAEEIYPLSRAYSLEVDLNVDGAMDFFYWGDQDDLSSNVTVDSIGSHPVLLYLNKNGVFEQTIVEWSGYEQEISPSRYNNITVHDWSGDLIPDVFFVEYETNSILFFETILDNHLNITLEFRQKWDLNHLVSTPNEALQEVTFGDLNNDGRIDVLTNLGILFQQGDASFTTVSKERLFPDVEEAHLETLVITTNSRRFQIKNRLTIIDINKDGLFDIVGGEEGAYYVNNGDKTFTQIPISNRIKVALPVDLNEDGHFDFMALTDQYEMEYLIYEEGEYLPFNEIPTESKVLDRTYFFEAVDVDGTNIPHTFTGGHFDNLSGVGAYQYRPFGMEFQYSLNLSSRSSFTFLDINNDQRLDIISHGLVNEENGVVSSNQAQSVIHLNTNPIGENESPNAPANVIIIQDPALRNGVEIQLELPQILDPNGLNNDYTYDYYLFDSTENRFLTTISARPNGKRTVSAKGRSSIDAPLVLKDLTAGHTYRIGVQIIDNGYLGSSFAMNEFTIEPRLFYDSKIALEPLQNATYSWAQVNDDSLKDLLVTGDDGFLSFTRLYIQQNDGSLEHVNPDPFSYVTDAQHVWLNTMDTSYPELFLYGKGNDTRYRMSYYVQDGANYRSKDIIGIYQTLDEFTSFSWQDVTFDGKRELVLTHPDEGIHAYEVTNHTHQSIIFTEIPLAEFGYEPESIVAILPSYRTINQQPVLWAALQTQEGIDIAMYQFDVEGLQERVRYKSPFSILDRNHPIQLIDVSGQLFPNVIVQGRTVNSNHEVLIYRVVENADQYGLEEIDGMGSSHPIQTHWIDVVGDEQLDLFFATRDNNAQAILKLYENRSEENAWELFDSSELLSTVQISNPSFLVTDMNHDFLPDLILPTMLNEEESLTLWLNSSNERRVPPSPPNGVEVAFPDNRTTILSWPEVEGALAYQVSLSTPSEDLTYRFGIQNEERSNQLYDENDVIYSTSFQIQLPQSTPFMASVQTIDSKRNTSDFSVPLPFVSPAFPFLPIEEVMVDIRDGDLYPVDLNSDGKMDLFYVGTTGFGVNNVGAFLQRDHHGKVGFSPLELRGIQHLSIGHLSFAEINGDIKPEIFISGVTSTGLKRSILYDYDLIDTVLHCTEVQTFTGVINGETLFFDADLDGDQDILLSGGGDFGGVMEYYENRGFQRESESPQFELRPGMFTTGYDFSSFDIADIDENGYPDLIVSGSTLNGIQTHVYLNQNGTFILDEGVSERLPENHYGTTRWVDVTSNGVNDVVSIGRDHHYVALNQGYENSTLPFVLIELPLPSLVGASLATGDINHDGFVDLVVTGRENLTGSFNDPTRTWILLNDNGTLFRLAPDDWIEGLPSGFKGSVELVDMNNDGALDLVFAANHAIKPRIFINQLPIIDGNDIHPNAAPETPRNVKRIRIEGQEFLKWDSGSDDHTASDALQYLLRISTSQEENNLFYSGVHPQTGTPVFVIRQTTHARTSIPLPEFESDEPIYIQVQAIDQSKKHSEWSNPVILNDPSVDNAEVRTIVEQGELEKRINIVFLAEAYREGEQDAFFQEATEMTRQLFEISPYREYESYFNSIGIFVPSQDSIISYGERIDATRGDKSTLGNSLQNEVQFYEKSTYFSAFRYNHGNKLFITIPNADSVKGNAKTVPGSYDKGFGKVEALLNTHVPEYDLVVILCKSNDLGGSAVLWQDRTIAFVGIPVEGSDVSPYQMHHRYSIFRHELAHSLGLGDEYGAETNVRDHFTANFPNTLYLEGANVFPQPELIDQIPWKNWINNTSTFDFRSVEHPNDHPNDVGFYAGAQYNNVDWYRAHYQDNMKNFLADSFGPVNREWIIKAIYGYRWQVEGMDEPFHRIRPISIIQNHTPNEEVIMVNDENPLQLSMDILRPTHINSISINYFIGDEVILSQNETLNKQASELPPGVYTIRGKVTDRTPPSEERPNEAFQDNFNQRWVIPAHDSLGYLSQEVEWIVDVQSNVSTERNTKAYSYSLHQNYPNPFNPSTTITYALAESGEVKLELYSVIGKKVATLVQRVQSQGVHSVTYDGSELASGVYFYVLTSKSFSQTKRMTLLK